MGSEERGTKTRQRWSAASCRRAFKSITGTELLHVPYRGSGPAVVDLVAGRVTMMFDATPSLLPFITAGQLRALAAASPQRHRLLPDAPSFAEIGYPAMDIALWYGIAAPSGTPQAIVRRLNAELVKILDLPGNRYGGSSPMPFIQFLKVKANNKGG